MENRRRQQKEEEVMQIMDSDEYLSYMEDAHAAFFGDLEDDRGDERGDEDENRWNDDGEDEWDDEEWEWEYEDELDASTPTKQGSSGSSRNLTPSSALCDCTV